MMNAVHHFRDFFLQPTTATDYDNVSDANGMGLLPLCFALGGLQWIDLLVCCLVLRFDMRCAGAAAEGPFTGGIRVEHAVACP